MKRTLMLTLSRYYTRETHLETRQVTQLQTGDVLYWSGQYPAGRLYTVKGTEALGAHRVVVHLEERLYGAPEDEVRAGALCAPVLDAAATMWVVQC